jgi:hypothetical protein
MDDLTHVIDNWKFSSKRYIDGKKDILSITFSSTGGAAPINLEQVFSVTSFPPQELGTFHTKNTRDPIARLLSMSTAHQPLIPYLKNGLISSPISLADRASELRKRR